MKSRAITNLNLTWEEQCILDGREGKVLQKVMQTIVAYGEALGAERLVDIEGNGHFVITYAIPGVAPSMEMLDELVAAGLKTKYPFTLDPQPPLDYDNWFFNRQQIGQLEDMYREQEKYNARMVELGLVSEKGCTCTPYLPEVGSVPEKGAVLAWSESACAIYANSVLGARTNKNGAIIDLLCNIIGKTPLAGLLTDEGRKADWLIDLQFESLPPPQLLGAAIGSTVLSGVPYIRGLDRFLGNDLNRKAKDYLHEMGAACATAGAIALFHAENITPEALESGPEILFEGYKTHSLDAVALDTLQQSYPVLWPESKGQPDKCFIGCPHLSLAQLEWWAVKIGGSLQKNKLEHLSVKTTFSAAPDVLDKFRNESSGYEVLQQAGAKLSPGCPMQIFDDGLSAEEAIVTNSNKLRAYTAARFVPDEELVEVIVTGEIQQAGGEQ